MLLCCLNWSWNTSQAKYRYPDFCLKFIILETLDGALSLFIQGYLLLRSRENQSCLLITVAANPIFGMSTRGECEMHCVY
jgi:hypothetical protein